MIEPKFETSLSLSDAMIEAANSIMDSGHIDLSIQDVEKSCSEMFQRKRQAFNSLFQAMLKDEKFSEILLSSKATSDELESISNAIDYANFLTNEVDYLPLSLLLYAPSLKHLLDNKGIVFKELYPVFPPDLSPGKMAHDEDAMREIRKALNLLEETYSDEQNSIKEVTGADEGVDDLSTEEWDKIMEEHYKEHLKSI